MASQNYSSQQSKKGFKAWFVAFVSPVPLIGWLLGILGAALVEYFLGDLISYYLGLPKIPVLFGFLSILKKPQLIPGTIGYLILVYGLPVLIIAKSLQKPANSLASFLDRRRVTLAALVHLGLFYGALHLWADISDYRLLILKLTMIAIMLTLSINVINGYMGEFSCSHPGFMALGAYAAVGKAGKTEQIPIGTSTRPVLLILPTIEKIAVPLLTYSPIRCAGTTLFSLHLP